MEHGTFIGSGPNPDGPDLPLGLGVELERHPEAREAFGAMTMAEKSALIRRIQGSATGEEARERIAEAIDKLWRPE